MMARLPDFDDPGITDHMARGLATEVRQRVQAAADRLRRELEDAGAAGVAITIRQNGRTIAHTETPTEETPA